MGRPIGLSSMAILASLLMMACETTPPPQGYHYEPDSVSKHPGRVLVKDLGPGETGEIRNTTPTGTEVAGEGHHYEYRVQNHKILRVVEKDHDPNFVPEKRIEVSLEERCPHCHYDYVTVIKQRSVIKWYCDANVHEKPQEQRKPEAKPEVKPEIVQPEK
jgi:hypothetical protein